MAYEPINPTLIPNTTMERYIDSNGAFKAYTIQPIDGYCLHDNSRDIYENYDEETGEPIGEPILGYTTAEASCGYNYDFTQTTTIDGYTAYGIFEFFARPISEVPADQIFGDVTPPVEVMSDDTETEAE